MKNLKWILLLAVGCPFAHQAVAQTCTGTGTRLITVETCSAVTSPADALVTIAPNPAADYFVVKNAGPALEFSLVDLLGRTVLSEKLGGQTAIRLETGAVPNGIYLACWRGAPFQNASFARIEICH